MTCLALCLHEAQRERTHTGPSRLGCDASPCEPPPGGEAKYFRPRKYAAHRDWAAASDADQAALAQGGFSGPSQGQPKAKQGSALPNRSAAESALGKRRQARRCPGELAS